MNGILKFRGKRAGISNSITPRSRTKLAHDSCPSSWAWTTKSNAIRVHITTREVHKKMNPRCSNPNNLRTFCKNDTSNIESNVNNTPPTFMLLNARSLVQRMDELELMLNLNNIQIAAISETWFPDTIDSSYFAIPGYTIFSKPRTNRRGGGVALYLQNNIQTRNLTELTIPEELEIVWVWVRPQRLPRPIAGLIVCVIYHPPSSPHDALLRDHLSSSLDILQTKYPNSGIVILGDFNFYHALVYHLCKLLLPQHFQVFRLFC